MLTRSFTCTLPRRAYTYGASGVQPVRTLGTAPTTISRMFSSKPSGDLKRDQINDPTEKLDAKIRQGLERVSTEELNRDVRPLREDRMDADSERIRMKMNEAMDADMREAFDPRGMASGLETAQTREGKGVADWEERSGRHVMQETKREAGRRFQESPISKEGIEPPITSSAKMYANAQATTNDSWFDENQTSSTMTTGMASSVLEKAQEVAQSATGMVKSAMDTVKEKTQQLVSDQSQSGGMANAMGYTMRDMSKEAQMKAQGMTETAKSKASDMSESMKDTMYQAQDKAQGVTETVKETMHQAQDKAQGMTESVKETVHQAQAKMHNATEAAKDTVHNVQEKAQDMTGTVMDKMNQARERVHDAAETAKQTLQSVKEKTKEMLMGESSSERSESERRRQEQQTLRRQGSY